MSADMAPHCDSISQVTGSALQDLAGLLSMPPGQLDEEMQSPNSDWLAGQATKITELPRCLQTPKGLRGLSRKLVDIGKGLGTNTATVVCDAHEGLNPRLVRHVFFYLNAEATVHADRVRRHDGHAALADIVRAWGDRMLGVSALWSDDALFRAAAGRSFPSAVRLPHLAEPCEACVLAAVGARGEVLADLRASMMSRVRVKVYERTRSERKKGRRKAEDEEKTRRVREPHLWPLVEAWIDRFGGDNAASIRQWSEALAGPLFEARKHEFKARRAARREYMARLGQGEALTAAEYRLARVRDPCALPPAAFTKAGHRMPLPRGNTLATSAAAAGSGGDGPCPSASGQPRASALELMRERERYAHEDGHYQDQRGGQNQGEYFPVDPTADPEVYGQEWHPLDDSDASDADDEGGELPADMRGWFRDAGGATIAPPEGDEHASDLDAAVHSPGDFAHPSAVPSPLTLSRGSRTNNHGVSSVSTMHTCNRSHRENDATPSPPVPRIPAEFANYRPSTPDGQTGGGLCATPGAPKATRVARETLAGEEEDSDTGTYVPARRTWAWVTTGAGGAEPLSSPYKPAYVEEEEEEEEDDNDDDHVHHDAHSTFSARLRREGNDNDVLPEDSLSIRGRRRLPVVPAHIYPIDQGEEQKKKIGWTW